MFAALGVLVAPLALQARRFQAAVASSTMPPTQYTYDAKVRAAFQGCRHLALTYDGACYSGHSYNIMLGVNAAATGAAAVFRPKAGS